MAVYLSNYVFPAVYCEYALLDCVSKFSAAFIKFGFLYLWHREIKKIWHLMGYFKFNRGTQYYSADH